jgi:CBS domain-containing protein
MKVSDVMWTDLKTVAPEETLSGVIVVMAEAHVSAVPVVDGSGRLVGVLSTTDILQAEADAESSKEHVRLLDHSTVEEIMTPRPLTIPPDAEVREAAQQMLYLEVHRLFVEDSGRLVGVISQSDIVRAVAGGKL